MNLKPLRYLLEYVLVVVFFYVPAALPLRVSRRLGEAVGGLAYYLWASRRRMAVENMRSVLQRGAIVSDRSAEDLIYENFRQLGRVTAEIVKIYFGFGADLIKSIHLEGFEHYYAARDRGKGVIMVFSHSSNWEMMIGIASIVGPIWGVGRRQDNPYIDKFIMKARQLHGGRMVYKEGAIRHYLKTLREGGTVSVAMDQAVSPQEGVLVEFLGAPAWTTKMGVALAKRTGAALLPAFIRMTPEGYVCTVLPEVTLQSDDEPAEVQRLVRYIEQYIRENPTQWLWIHNRWKKTKGLTLNDLGKPFHELDYS